MAWADARDVLHGHVEGLGYDVFAIHPRALQVLNAVQIVMPPPAFETGQDEGMAFRDLTFTQTIAVLHAIGGDEFRVADAVHAAALAITDAIAPDATLGATAKEVGDIRWTEGEVEEDETGQEYLVMRAELAIVLSYPFRASS